MTIATAMAITMPIATARAMDRAMAEQELWLPQGCGSGSGCSCRRGLKK